MMRRLTAILAALALGALAAVAYTKLMARIGSGTPPAMAATSEQADEIIVQKDAREMQLMRDGQVIARYDISLGASPKGHKREEGDEKTPEGTYAIDWRNQNSVAHLSLHISYPNPEDAAAAEARGTSPGGQIMIHGLPNGWGVFGRLHLLYDWTNGCVAVTNAQMREIWSLVPDGTPITIVESS